MFIANSQYVDFCCVICDLPSKQFIESFGRFDSESIYSSLLGAWRPKALNILFAGLTTY